MPLQPATSALNYVVRRQNPPSGIRTPGEAPEAEESGEREDDRCLRRYAGSQAGIRWRIRGTSFVLCDRWSQSGTDPATHRSDEVHLQTHLCSNRNEWKQE